MKVNALQLRQRLGGVLDELDRHGQPVIIEKGRVPRAVLIPLSLFKERFLDFQDQRLRRELLDEIRAAAEPSERSSLELLRELRYGSDDEGTPP